MPRLQHPIASGHIPLLVWVMAMVVLGVPLVWADNSGEIAPFPLTGAYRATHREDRGHIAIIDFVGNYNKDLDTGESNVEARAVVAREFLRTHPDTYDFLVVFSTFEFATGDALAFHWGVQNKVQGLGLAQYDVSHLFGSAGRLLGYIDMAALTRYVTDPLQPAFETVLATLGHEMLHQWSGRARFMDASGHLSTALLGRDSSHWSDLLDTNASVLYGHKWRNNHDGSFTSQAMRKFFSPLDLYLAGVYSAAEVPPFLLIDNPQHDPTVLPQANITVQGTARPITIDEVIAAEGPRIPAAAQTPKTFRFAWILLTGSEDTVEESQLAAMTEVSKKFAERFAVWTGGRALVQVAPEALLTVTTGTPDTLPGGQVRVAPAALHTALQDGLTWLRNQQRGDGSWMDKLATQLRDTTVALDVLSRLDLSFTGQTTAIAWLAAQIPESSDYRARQARALLAVDATATGLLGSLVALRNADGGWGISAGYASDPLDTALVVTAAAQRSEVDARIIDQALQYLLDSHNADGGWGTLVGGPSRVSVTTRVLLALQTFRRQQPVQDAALTWLASQQQSDGGFGESASTVHDTALALQACIALGAVTQIRAAEAAAYLLARQQTDGSWEGSTYATALAVGTLKNLHFPNWYIDSTVSIDVDQPVDGAQLTLTLTVRNDGQSPTPAGIVRLFDGEPAQGGQQIGSDVVVPALVSGASVTLRLPWDTFGAAGEHTLIALIDPENGQPEVSERDNRVTRTITVAAAPDGVDLAVETFTVMPARPDTLPTTLGLSAIIRNTGMSSAEQVRVQLREGESGSLLDEVTLHIAGRSSVAAPFTYMLSKPGVTTFLLVIDPDNAIVETSKTNNTTTTTVETTPSVDLQVHAGDIAMAPVPALQGADLTFTVTLHNPGTSVSPVTTVQYLLTDGKHTLDLGRQTVRIEAGSTVQRTLPWRATLLGDCIFTVQLDPDRLVPERDEQNNAASFHFSVGVAQGPNLVVSFQDMTSAPDPGLAGKPVTLSALVRNTGAVDARDVVVAFYDGDPAHGGVQIARQTMALLPAATATTVSTIWPRLPGAADKIIFVSVDPDNTIAEFSEADNSTFRVLTVLSLPDLAIDPAAVRLTPGFPTLGATVQIEAQVTNLGAQAASDVVVRAFAGDPATGGVQIGTDQRVSVAGGGVAVAPFIWTLSGTETLRTLVIVVDPDNTLEEVSKLNNVAQKRFAAQDNDFFVSNPYFSPNGDGIKDNTTFFFRLQAASTVEVVAMDKDGTVVRHIQNDGVTQTRDGSVAWDGLDDRGRVVRDGSYHLQVRSPAGQSLGEVTVIVDNNRSSLVEAAGTPFGLLTNLTCTRGDITDFIVTNDESTIFFVEHKSGVHRMTGSGTDVTPLVLLQPDEFIPWLRIAPDGSLVAYVRRTTRDSNQNKLFVIQGDGTNLRELALTDNPATIFAVVKATNEVILLVRERSGAFRLKLVAVPLSGGAPRLIHNTADLPNEIDFHDLSPQGDRLIFSEATKAGVLYYVLDLVTGAKRLLTTNVHSLSIHDVKLAPDGAHVAIKYAHKNQQGVEQITIAVVHTQSSLRTDIDLPLPGTLNSCIVTASYNMAWSPASDALAFDLAQESKSTSACGTQKVFSGGLYITDINTGISKKVFTFDDTFRDYFPNPYPRSLGWFLDAEALFYGFPNKDIHAIFLDQDAGNTKMLAHSKPLDTVRGYVQLSPTGRQILYQDDKDTNNPQSVCYRPFSNDVLSYKSLRNLTADLRATPVPQGGGILLQGTVSDANFDSYLLEYAATIEPQNWRPLQLASDQMVINDVLTTWVPPGPGTYLVRLTATDLAGNQRQQIVRTAWADPTSISDLYRAPALFSPNGDGTAEDTTIHYRVLEPVHLAFDISNAAGERVRTILRDHTTIGAEQILVWDGRDDNGLLLPDGLYRLQVQNFTLPITLDNTPPVLTLSLADPYQSVEVHVGNHTVAKVQVAPALTWSITEAHYRQALIEKASIHRPDQWQPFIVLGPLQTGDRQSEKRGLILDEVDGALFRFVAEDTAGNRTIVRVGPVAPQLIIAGFGDHKSNEAVQDCFRHPGSGDLESCVQEQGGYYQPLEQALYAPLDATDGPLDSVMLVTAPHVRFAIAESIAEPLTQVSVQYRPLSDPQWQEMPLTQFLDHAPLPRAFSQPLERRMEAVWELSTLASNVTYVVRLKAIDRANQLHVSNALRFTVENAVVFHGLVQETAPEERLQYALPRTFSPGKTGLWGLNVSREELREVRLILSSPDDPRYRVAQEVDRIAQPGQVLVFEVPLAACKTYEAIVIGTTLTGVPAQSVGVVFQLPCLNMIVQIEPQPGVTCNGPSAQRLRVRFAPASLNGDPLKILTFARLGGDGHEDIVFNVNRPRSVPLPQVPTSAPHMFVYDPGSLGLLPGEPDYPYTFVYDTSTVSEGRLAFTARLVDSNDAAISLPVVLTVDHTPPTLALTYPTEGGRVCGVPTVGQDGQLRNVVTLEGSAADANGLHYLVQAEGAVIHDSRTRNSFAVAQGQAAVFLHPPNPSFHLKRVDGPLAQFADHLGEVTTRVEVFDVGGFRQCVQRTFFVDAGVEVDPPTLARELFSPNGDGNADDVTLLYQTYEPVTLDITVYAAGEDSHGVKQTIGEVLHHLESGKTLLSGGGFSTWNGRDDGGMVLPDGLYGLVLLLTDACGNQQRYERFVEIDTAPPQVVIDYPHPQDPLMLTVEIQGTVVDPHLSAYRVQVGGGTAPETWATLSIGAGNLASTVLARWNTFGLSGPYVLRVVAQDSVGNTTTVTVPLTITVRTNLVSAITVTPPLFSPNGDAKRDQTSLRLSIEDDVVFTLTIRAADGTVHRTLATNRAASRGAVLLAWDGTNDAGFVVPDGVYTVALQAVLARNPAVSQQENITVSVDITPPSIALTRPASGVVTATGQVQGSITDQHLNTYTVSLTETPLGLQTRLLSSGTSNAVTAHLGSLQGLQEGRYTLKVEARDAGENSATTQVAFVVDNTPPVVDLTAPAPGSVLGRKQNPVVVKGVITETHVARYQLNVGAGADPSAWVSLANSTQMSGTDVLGTWNIASLADGLYTLQVLVDDQAGLRAEKRLQLTIDNTAPTAALSTPGDGSYVSVPLMITGSATDTHLASYRLEITSATASTQWSPIGSGVSTVQNGLLLQWPSLPPDGAYLLRLTAVDRAGNSAETVRRITVDTTPPGAPTGLRASIVNRQVHLAWQASPATDLTGYTVSRDGQRLTPTLLTIPEYMDTTVSEGRYVYTVTASDQAGLTSAPSAALTVTVDFTPPQVKIFGPVPGATVSGVVDIRGTAYSKDDFKVYRVSVGAGVSPTVWQLLRQSSAPAQADILMQWSTLGLSEGAAYGLKLEAEDINGNVSSEQISVTIDNQAPAPPTGLIARVTNADVALTWNANNEPDLLGYLIYRNGRLVQVNASGSDLRPFAVRTPAYTDRAVVDGAHTYTAAAIDQAGNVSAPSALITVTVNSRTPQAVIVQPKDGTVFDGSLYVLAAVQDNDVAQVQWQYKAATASSWLILGSADTAAPYETTFSPAALGLSFGVYMLRAVATDTTNRSDPAPPALTVTYADRTRPQRVQGLMAQVDGDTVHVQWTANGTSDLAGYHVERQRHNEVAVRLTTTPLTSTSYVDHGLADAAYRYAVIALDTHSNASDSAVVDATVYTPLLPAPHTPTTATTVTLAGRGITAATVTGTVVTPTGSSTITSVSTDASGSFSLPALPLVPGHNAFTLYLTDAVGNRSKPVTVTVILAQPPSQPTGLVAAVHDTTISFTWNANPEADVVGYRLWRNGTPVLANRDITEMASVSGLMLTWPELRQVTQVQIQWASAAQRASDFDLEAWSGQQWVGLAQIRGNQQNHNTITLPQAYRTTQIRLVVLQPAGPLPPSVVAFGGLYSPLITGTAYDDHVLDGRYTYTLTAVNTYGFESIPSAPVAVTVGDVIAPEAVVLTATVLNADVSLQWTPGPASDVQRYDLSRNGAVIAQITAPGTRQYVDAGLINGTYAYTVTAVDHVGNVSNPSNRVDVAVAVALPGAPLNLTVRTVATGSALELHWSPAPGAAPQHFRVWRGTRAGGPYTVTADTTTASLTDAELHNDTTYYYVVAALDTVGNASPFSNEASGIPRDLIAPEPPKLSFPTVPGRAFLSKSPDLMIIGTAEPAAQVELLAHGQRIDVTWAQDTLETLEVALPVTVQSLLSPDGRYAAVIEGGIFAGLTIGILRLYDSETDTFRDVTAVIQTTSLRWLSDSSALLFNQFDPVNRTFVVRQYMLVDNHLEDLTNAKETDIAAAVASPDGTRLIVSGAVRGRFGLWLLDSATQNYTPLVSTGSATVIDGTSLQWSPDGAYLAYKRQNAYELVNIATGATRSIDPAASVYLPQWAPDGQALLYTSTNPPAQIRRYDLHTGTAQDVAVGLAPQWSADGQALVYMDKTATTVISRNLATGTETTLVQDTVLIPKSLQVVPGGFVGVLSTPTTAASTYRRLTLPGHVVFAHVSVEHGDNSFTARTIDTAGNISAASEAILITYQGANQADLTLAADAVLVLPAIPRAGERTHVSVTVSNSGELAAAATTVSLVALNPAGEATVLLDEAALPALPAGENYTLTAEWTVTGGSGRYTLVAVVDPNNTIVEQSKVNNVALKDLLVPATALPTVTVSTDAPVYHAQQLVTATGRLTNGGDAWTGQIVISVTDATGFLVQTLQDEVLTGLAYGESREFTATWQTGATFAGAYQIVARLVDPPGTVIAVATAPFTLAESTSLISSVASDQRTYTAHTQVQVTGTLAYTAGNALLPDIAVQLQIRNASDEVVATQTTILGDLVPGATATVELDWNTGTAAVGVYQLRLDAFQTGQPLSQARSQMTIVPGGLRVAGSLTVSEEMPSPGMTQTAVYTVVNQGNGPIMQLPLMLSLVDAAAGSALQEHRIQADIPVAQHITGSVDFTIPTLTLQSYNILLQAEVDNGSGSVERRTLATQPFVATDRSAPVVELRIPAGNGFLNSSGTVAIFARDDFSQVTHTEFRLDGGAWQPGMVSDAVGNLYSAALPQMVEGNHTIQVRATDTFGNVRVSPEATFIVDNTPPQIVVTGVLDGGMYARDVTPVISVTDANLEVTTLSLNGVTFVSGTVVGNEGPYQLAIAASDKAGNRAEVTLNFVIEKAAPVITIQGVQDNAVYQGTPYTYQVGATDADGDALGYTLLAAPPGMVIDASGRITWWPRQPGNYAVTVRVEDAHGAADTQSYTLAVTLSNLAPEILSAPVVDVVVPQHYDYVVDAVDPNGDLLTYSLDMAPVGMEIDAVTGHITWIPTTRGDVAVVVRVQDQYGAAATQSYTLRAR